MDVLHLKNARWIRMVDMPNGWVNWLHGDAFVLRDHQEFRPAHYSQDDEVVVVTSERRAIQNGFQLCLWNLHKENKAWWITHLIIKKRRTVSEAILVREPLEESNVRSWADLFSRGKWRGYLLMNEKNRKYPITPEVLKSIDYDCGQNSVVFIYPELPQKLLFYGIWWKGRKITSTKPSLKEIEH